MRSLLIGVILSGCTQVLGECPESPQTSVRLQVVDGLGQTVYGAEATYSVDGDRPAPCDDWTGTDPLCGEDVAGDVDVHVEADGFAAWDQVIFVPGGSCHVVPQDVRAVLEPLDPCEGTSPAPAVSATIVGEEGEYLEDVAVTWMGDGSNGDCDPPLSPGGAWTCGWEQSGAIAVTASAEGHAAATVTVDVPGGECHPSTQTIEVALDWDWTLTSDSD